ncbi:MAG: maleylpyruvate isomerase family mycothiol-dependent enzyme [Nocardioidaceae bacterium]
MNAVLRPSTTVDFVEEYAAAAERLAVAVAWSDLRAPIAGCPGWTTYDLVVHIGNVHAWAATIVETGRAAAQQNDKPAHARPRSVSGWYAGKAEDLYEVLRSADPAAPCWNFAFGSGRTAFWPRRQVHEATIHQVDLDRTLGRATDIAPAIARDGVDEVLRVFLHRMHTRGHAADLSGPVALTATDTGDTWVVAPQPRSPSTPMVPAQAVGTTSEKVLALVPSIEHGASPGPTPDRVEAPAAVLYRLLWKRLSLDDESAADARVLGDEGRVRAFLDSRLVP